MPSNWKSSFLAHSLGAEASSNLRGGHGHVWRSCMFYRLLFALLWNPTAKQGYDRVIYWFFTYVDLAEAENREWHFFTSETQHHQCAPWHGAQWGDVEGGVTGLGRRGQETVLPKLLPGLESVPMVPNMTKVVERTLVWDLPKVTKPNWRHFTACRGVNDFQQQSKEIRLPVPGTKASVSPWKPVWNPFGSVLTNVCPIHIHWRVHLKYPTVGGGQGGRHTGDTLLGLCFKPEWVEKGWSEKNNWETTRVSCLSLCRLTSKSQKIKLSY